MKVSDVSQEDAKQLAFAFQIINAGNRIIKGLASAGIDFEGEAFKDKQATVKWLQALSDMMVKDLHPKSVGTPKRKVSSKTSKTSKAATKKPAKKKVSKK